MSRRNRFEDSLSEIDAGMRKMARGFGTLVDVYAEVSRQKFALKTVLPNGVTHANEAFLFEQQLGVEPLARTIVQRMRGLGLHAVLNAAGWPGASGEDWTDGFVKKIQRL